MSCPNQSGPVDHKRYCRYWNCIIVLVPYGQPELYNHFDRHTYNIWTSRIRMVAAIDFGLLKRRFRPLSLPLMINYHLHVKLCYDIRNICVDASIFSKYK
eukprot:NODE_439_length_7399_cov_0.767397.p5 type:complete len:100 gc:universal NODE_439_length_7399_cov_0.767397:1756-2055(+)